MNTTVRTIALGLGVLTANGCSLGRPVSTVERSFAAHGVTAIVLDDGAGDVVVIGEPGREEVTLVAELLSSTVSPKNDDSAEAALRVAFEVDDATGYITAGLADAPRGYRVDLVALVPQRVVLDIEDDSGDIEIEGVAGVELRDDSGDVDIHEIGDGGVTVRDGSGDLSISDVGGDLWVEDGSGDMAIDGVVGPVVIFDGSGDISVRGAADVDIRADSSGDTAIE